MIMFDVEILRAACCLAGLDGEVSERELPVLQKLADHAGVGSVSLQAMIDRAKRDPNFYQEQFRHLRADPLAAMKSIFAVAIADGHLTVDERVVLQYFSQKLGLPDERFEELSQAAQAFIARRQKNPDAVETTESGW